MSEEGAVTREQCPYGGGPNRCRCGRCAVCGEKKHTSIHGPACGQPAGSKPWGHAFVPRSPAAEFKRGDRVEMTEEGVRAGVQGRSNPRGVVVKLTVQGTLYVLHDGSTVVKRYSPHWFRKVPADPEPGSAAAMEARALRLACHLEDDPWEEP